jgi:copper oxidase (laccase) domain-containing protein
MNSLRVSEIHPDSQLNTNTIRTANTYRQDAIGDNTVVSAEQLKKGINYLTVAGVTVGQTFAIDVEPRSDDGQNPQPGIIAFAKELGILQEQLSMPRLSQHTTNVLVVEGLKELNFTPEEGRLSGFDEETGSEFFDSLIIKRTTETEKLVLAITGADCPSVVGQAQLSDGTEVLIGIHAGRKGCLGGIIEKTADALRALDIIPGSLRLVVGPGGQVMELPLEVIEKEALQNSYAQTAEVWHDSITVEYSKIDTRKSTVVYDNHADVVRRTRLVFDGLFATDGLAVIDANTITTEGLKSHRAKTIAASKEDSLAVDSKLGRNALFTRFS